MTLQQFVEKHKITLDCVLRQDSNPNSEYFDKHAFHYLIEIGKDGLGPYYENYLSCGRELSEDTILMDFLECIQVDCQSGEISRFEHFADEFGYDQDSRKAERIYNACVKTALEFREFLGIQAYHEFLEATEE